MLRDASRGEEKSQEERIAALVVERLEARLRPSEWMKMKEAAAHVNLDYWKFARLVRSGEIPSHKLDGSIRINRAELDEWALSQDAQ